MSKKKFVEKRKSHIIDPGLIYGTLRYDSVGRPAAFWEMHRAVRFLYRSFIGKLTLGVPQDGGTRHGGMQCARVKRGV